MALVRTPQTAGAPYALGALLVVVVTLLGLLYINFVFGREYSVPAIQSLAGSLAPLYAPPYALAAGLLLALSATGLFCIGILYRARMNEEELIAMKSDFIAAASHELRSPLTSIRWTLSTLRDDPSLPQDARTTVNDLYERVRGLIDLSNTFLITASTDHGVMRPEDLKVVNFAPTLMTAIQHITTNARMKNIKIETTFPTGEPIIIRGDAERLRLVFENLLTNAIKYSPRESKVTVSYQDLGAMRAFSVHDQGIGVPKKDQKTIFEGFKRAGNAKKSGILGSGFGLYMVKKIVDFHGGTVSCTSEPDQGSTFTVVIPSGV